jgi:DNA-binding HxlR family transcriptional regulator
MQVKYDCPVEATVAALGDKWKMILPDLSSRR